MLPGPWFCGFLILVTCEYAWALSSSTIPSFTHSAVSSLTPPTSKTEVIVVGGGPVGLATALQLSRPPHSCRVAVLERQAGNGQAQYDPTRSYLYNVNPRGLLWFDRYERLDDNDCNDDDGGRVSPFQNLVAKGSAPTRGLGSFLTVPADPQQPLSSPGEVTLGTGNVTVPLKRSYWIPRHQMVELLQDECRHANVTLVHGKSMDSLVTNNGDDSSVTVVCTDGTQYTAQLIVAADGYESSVREYLRQTPPPKGWLSAPFWRVRRFRSPATGVKLKALQFPPNFTIPNITSTYQSKSEEIYVFRGKQDGTRTRLSLGFLPVKDPSLVRPGNTNTRYNHVLWSIQHGPEMKQFFATNFPRFHWDDYVSDEEWERFAQANGTSFPFCQHSTGNALWSPTGQAGVVLVGDACHAFPPDIGQGINAGLQDVVALDQALRGETIDTSVQEENPVNVTFNPNNLSQALAAYQTNRVPEHKALIRLARFGSPYQYRQSWRRDRIGRFLWTVNVALRLGLNKLSFSRLPPAAILLANQKPDLSYRQVMARADRLTLALKRLFVEAIALRLGIVKLSWVGVGWVATALIVMLMSKSITAT